MTVLLLSFTAVETTELALHEVSGETDGVFLSLSRDSKTAAQTHQCKLTSLTSRRKHRLFLHEQYLQYCTNRK